MKLFVKKNRKCERINWIVWQLTELHIFQWKALRKQQSLISRDTCTTYFRLCYFHGHCNEDLCSYCEQHVTKKTFQYSLTPRGRVLNKLIAVEIDKKFFAFYGHWRLTVVFTGARDWSLSWASSIHSTPYTIFKTILILSF
jgi:hypothetical protein